MLFSCKIHIKNSLVLLLSSALPSIFFSLSLLCPHACDILYQRALVEKKLSFTPSAFAFFPPKLRTSNAHALHWEQSTCWCCVTRASSQIHNVGVFVYGWPSSALLALVQLQRQTYLLCPCILICATKVKRKSFKYPNILPQFFPLFGMLELSFLGQKCSISIYSQKVALGS